MSTREKLIKRFLDQPSDFKFDELRRLLSFFGYQEIQGAGSRVIFRNNRNKHSIKLHKPHPGNTLKRYQSKLILKELKNKKLM